jgi:hypothetical protein
MKMKNIEPENIYPVCGTEEIDPVGRIESQGDLNGLSELEARVPFECENGHSFYKYYDLEYVKSEEIMG